MIFYQEEINFMIISLTREESAIIIRDNLEQKGLNVADLKDICFTVNLNPLDIRADCVVTYKKD